MAEEPKVFISYSHDSPDHKRWAAMLATKLRDNGVDAILDQWEIGPGDDVPLFMERELSAASRVLVVCTPEYVRKAESGEGGVGYERIILTAELVNDVASTKFIPIIRAGSEEHLKPVFLETKYHVDFRNDEEFEAKLDELLRALLNAPAVDKPPLGKNPFGKSPSGEDVTVEVSPSTGVPTIPEATENLKEVYPTLFTSEVRKRRRMAPRVGRIPT